MAVTLRQCLCALHRCSSHGGAHQVELAGDAVLLERPRDRRPHLPQILFCSHAGILSMWVYKCRCSCCKSKDSMASARCQTHCTAEISGGSVMIVAKATQTAFSQPQGMRYCCAAAVTWSGGDEMRTTCYAQ